MRKRVYVAYTGGTIGMVRSPQGYTPSPGFLKDQLQAMTDLTGDGMPHFEVHEYADLLDSANITPENWFQIAEDIQGHYDDYDGFIILHGTDTMAFTASALTFMFGDTLRKPVIVTGSQIPLFEVRNDARENLITTLLLASQWPIPEVCLYFGDKLLRGCRSTKLHANGFAAFDSPNYPPLGDIGVSISVHWHRVRQLIGEATEPLSIIRPAEGTVAAVRLFPGMDYQLLERIVQPPLQGLILETFGMGNGPDRDVHFLRVLREAIDSGVVVVNTSQCLMGGVDQESYASGRALAEIGVISGADMTMEAALTKLSVLFGSGLAIDDVKAMVDRNLYGELTPPSLPPQTWAMARS